MKAPPDPARAGDWRPSARWETLRLRALLLGEARRFFADRGIIEVETPALIRYGVTDVQLASIPVRRATPDGHGFWLHTSPEFHMKRLLAAGAPDIYQICKVFRDAEQGRHHEPEFTLIEWYRHGAGLDGIIADTVALAFTLARAAGQVPGPVAELRYPALAGAALDCDPLTAPVGQLRQRVRQLLGPELVSDALEASLGDDATAWLDLLMSHHIVPGLPPDQLSVIRDYPVAQAALARRKPADPRVAERFELFHRGLELANGYHELCNAEEQRARFDRDVALRRASGRPAMAADPRLTAALEAGLPDCAGVALGFDRLLMALTGEPDIAAVISFAGDRR